MMEQRGDTTLQKSGIRRDIRKAFERILIPLEKADKNRLPSRMDMTFRKNIVRQIDRLNQQKLCREILMTDVETQPDNDLNAGTMMDENGENLSSSAVSGTPDFH